MRQDMAVAYVSAEIELTSSGIATPITSDELILRCVRMLRTVTRPDDTVARLGGNVFAILMPGLSAGNSFGRKLSRLVALGLMRDSIDPREPPIQFRIAATTFGSFSGTSQYLDKALKQKLNNLKRVPGRTIEFLLN